MSIKKTLRIFRNKIYNGQIYKKHRVYCKITKTKKSCEKNAKKNRPNLLNDQFRSNFMVVTGSRKIKKKTKIFKKYKI